MPFPAPPHHLADRDEMAAYLERYAARFDLPVRLNTRVGSVGANGDRFTVRTDGGCVLEADNVIVATGPFRTPRIPDVSTRLDA